MNYLDDLEPPHRADDSVVAVIFVCVVILLLAGVL